MAKNKVVDEGTLTYDSFRAEMKAGNFSNLYHFRGNESFLLEYCVGELKKALINPAFEDFNYKCYIEAPDFESAGSFIFSLPLMSEKKLVVFNNCSLFDNKLPEKARWAEMFSSLPQHVVVVVREEDAPQKKKSGEKRRVSEVKSAVAKAAKIVNFDYLDAARLRPWLTRAASGKGKSLLPQDAAYIIATLGRSMTLLRAELDKIVSKSEDFEIKRADIDSVIIKPLTATVYKLIDALCAARRDLAFAAVDELLAMREEGSDILGTIAAQMISIHKAKIFLAGGMSTTDVKKALGGDFKAGKFVSNASKTTFSYIESVIHFLKETDFGTKNGEMDVRTRLYLLVAI